MVMLYAGGYALCRWLRFMQFYDSCRRAIGGETLQRLPTSFFCFSLLKLGLEGIEGKVDSLFKRIGSL